MKAGGSALAEYDVPAGAGTSRRCSRGCLSLSCSKWHCKRAGGLALTSARLCTATTTFITATSVEFTGAVRGGTGRRVFEHYFETHENVQIGAIIQHFDFVVRELLGDDV